MQLIIKLEQNNIQLSFHQAGRVIDTETAKDYHDLSVVLTPLEVSRIISKGYIIKGSNHIYRELLTGLISCLDKLLKRNKLDLKAIKGYKMLGNLGTDSSSYKITSALIGGLQI